MALNGPRRNNEDDDSFRHRVQCASKAQLVWLLGMLGAISRDLSWRSQTLIVEEYAIESLNRSYKQDLVK